MAVPRPPSLRNIAPIRQLPSRSGLSLACWHGAKRPRAMVANFGELSCQGNPAPGNELLKRKPSPTPKTSATMKPRRALRSSPDGMSDALSVQVRPLRRKPRPPQCRHRCVVVETIDLSGTKPEGNGSRGGRATQIVAQPHGVPPIKDEGIRQVLPFSVCRQRLSTLRVS